MYDEILAEIGKYANPSKAEHALKFFKAFPGGYGGKDSFNGATVPQGQKVAKAYYKVASLEVIEKLLHHKVHEVRLLALQMLVYRFPKSDSIEKLAIYELYLRNTKYINNWDLVDLSCYKIVGQWLLDKNDRSLLYRFAESQNMWEQRISIISTFAFMRVGQLDDTFALADKLLDHSHDLMHKAVGWMLREAGKRDMDRLKKYIKDNYARFPRTALRYAIEKFPEDERKSVLKGIF